MKKVFFLTVAWLFVSLLSLQADKAEPLRNEMFVRDLTVPASLVPVGQSLSLDEATRLALAKNLGIQIARLQEEGSQKDLQIARAIYDTNFEVLGDYSHDSQQRASVILGSREINAGLQTSLRKQLPTGTDIKITAGAERSSTTTTFTTLKKNYMGFVELAVEQPLLKNFFGYIDRAEIKKVKINTKKFTYQKLQEIENSVAEVRNAFWDLVFAKQNFETRKQALRKAQDFYSLTVEKLDLGLSEKPDLHAAEANVRERVIETEEAATNLHRASFKLRILLDETEIPFISPHFSEGFQPVHLDFEQALAEAFETRWDLKQAMLNLQEQDIERKIKQNELLPDLHFKGAYTSTSLDRDMADSLGESYGFNHPQYVAEVALTTPLELRKERGEYTQSKLGLKVAEKQLEEVKLQIAQEMDDAYRRLLLAENQVAQRALIEELQRKKLKEEEKNFGRGRSDAKTIIDYQQDVINAEVNAIASLVNYYKTLDAFYQAKNTLLEEVGTTTSDALVVSEDFQGEVAS